MISLITYEYTNDPHEIIKVLDSDKKILEWLHDSLVGKHEVEMLKELYDTMLEFQKCNLMHHAELIREFLEQLNLELLN